MNAEVEEFFTKIKFPFTIGYGMTECAPLISYSNNKVFVPKSAGKVLDVMEVKIIDPEPATGIGEICVKGENVMSGYFKNPEATANMIDEDGWLHTGDLGDISEDGYIKVTGRKKDIIITAGGKNISPAPLEDTINTCPIVSHTVVIGDGRPFVAALIALDEEMTRDWLKNQGMDAEMPMEQIANNDAVRAFVQQYIDQANSSVSRAESVRKFAILPDDFSQDAGTLTPSMKVVRKKVIERYDDIIEHVIYTPKGPSVPIPATVKLFDKTAETVSQVSETVSPKVKQAIDQAKSNMAELRAKRRDENSDEELAQGTDAETQDNGTENTNETEEK